MTGRRARPRAGHRTARWAALFGSLTAVATAGGLAGAYVTLSAQGSGQVQVTTLAPPGAGTAVAAGSTSVPLSWSPSPGLPPGGGYAVYRATSSTGPWAPVDSGGCGAATTEATATPSCTDSGLVPDTTYWYEVYAAFPGASPAWLSALPDTPFAATTTAQATTTQVSATTPSSAPAGTLFTAAATVVAAAGYGTPSGTVSFALYSGPGCAGPAVVSGSPVPLVSGSATGTIVPAAVGTYSWGATYVPTDAHDVGSTGCAPTTVTATAP